MRKETAEYLSGQRNVTKEELIISRESKGTSELIFVCLPDSEAPLYQFWNSRRCRRYKKVEVDGQTKFEKLPARSTGGKAAYAMVMLAELEKIEGLSIEAYGVILKLSCCMEWNTGKLIRQRDKRDMTFGMMADFLGVGEKKLQGIMKELKNLGILEFKNSAYFMAKKLIRKGGST